MKPLDMVPSIDYGYRLAWVERDYLLRLAVVPVAIKLGCYLAVIAAGFDSSYIRTALFLLPSMFADGWMLAHLVRLVFYDQRWPFRASADPADRAADAAMLADRAHGIMAGTLFYVLAKFLLSGLLAFVIPPQLAMQARMAAGTQTPDGPEGPLVFVAIGMVLLTLWAFRLLFLYIPAAAGLGAGPVLRSSRSFLFSCQIFGVWLVCFIPLGLLARLLSGIVAPPVPPGVEPGLLAQFLPLTVQVFMDTAIALVSTAAIASGLKGMLSEGRQS